MTGNHQLFALTAYGLITIAIIGVLLVAAWWLGAKTGNRNKDLPYESGIIPTGSARIAQYIPFYLVAIFFIVFDVETAFILTWASVWDILGLAGMVHISFFIIALLLGLVWVWLKGGLDWGPSKERDAAFPQSRR